MSAGERVMMTQEPGGTGPAPRDREEPQRSDRIGVGSNDDTVVRFQLAARWAEEFAPKQDDSLGAMLRRFRTAYQYLDAVMHGIEPPELPEPAAESAAPPPAAPEPPTPPPFAV